MELLVLKFVWAAVFIWSGVMLYRAKKSGVSNDICAAVLPVGVIIGISISTVVSLILN